MRRGRAQHADRQQQRADVEHEPLRRLSTAGPRSGAQVIDSALQSVSSDEPAEREPAGARAAAAAPGRRGVSAEHERPHHDRRDQPRLGEVAAGEERQRGRAGEQQDRGDGEHGAAHGAAGYIVARALRLQSAMRRRWWRRLVALVVLGRRPASAAPTTSCSCGAPGAGGVNRAWQSYRTFDDRFYDLATQLPGALGLVGARAPA